MNNITITGRLTADPELKQTQSGLAVTSFNVAVDRNYTAKGQEKQTDFFTVVAWRGTAEFICKYFTKGRLILINGEMQSRKYTDKDGNNRTAWEVLADKVEFMGDGKKDGNSADNAPAPASAVAHDVPELSGDDYPF
jgi:single-strand DNA-binding protein